MTVADDLDEPLYAGLVHIRLLHPLMIYNTYRRVCKKFLRTFLLHHIIELNQILPMTSHILLLIEAVAPNTPGSVSQLNPGNRFLIVPSTKIFFARKSNSRPSCDRTLNSNKGCIGQLKSSSISPNLCIESQRFLSQGGIQSHHLNSEVQKVETILELRRELVAESHFFTSVINSISSGLENREENSHPSYLGSKSKYEVPSKCEQSICENAGMIVESDAAGGKTLLLELLHRIYESKGSCLLRSKELVSKNRGEIEGSLLALIQDCSARGCRLILIDDIDILATDSGSDNSSSDNYIYSALLHGIDAIVLKHNREHRNKRMFVVATCTNGKRVGSELLVPHRLGDLKSMIRLPYPSQRKRLSLIFNLLCCSGIDVTWDIARDGYSDHDYSSSMNAHEDHSDSTHVKLRLRLNAYYLALTLSHGTQGASESDLVGALKQCYLDSVSSTEMQHTFPSADSRSPSAAVNNISGSSLRGGVKILSSDFMRLVREIRPAVALKHDIASLLADSTESPTDGREECLVGIEPLQDRLRKSVLLPYELSTLSGKHRHGQSDIGSCSGVLIHGPSGCGKTSLARWLALEGRRHFKLLTVACADLVHKVVGESERKLSQVFSAAREMAPCFLLLDNLEIILGSGVTGAEGGQGVRAGRRRTAHQALDRLLSTLLVEIDGLASSRTLHQLSQRDSRGNWNSQAGSDVSSSGGGAQGRNGAVIVIATTCDINLIDRSLIRPGRLEEHIAMQLPDAEQRSTMFAHFRDEMFRAPHHPHDQNLSGDAVPVPVTDRQMFVERAKRILDCDSKNWEVAKLRSPGELKNFIAERGLALIRNHAM